MQNYKVIETNNVPIKAWTRWVQMEAEAQAQLENLATLPFIHKHLAVMPDCHSGKGSTVGTVIATSKAIIPAAVGVDIGCGMIATKLNLTASDLPENLAPLRSLIEKYVPHGRTNDGRKGDRGAWFNVPSLQEAIWANRFDATYKLMLDKHPLLKSHNTANHLGTLGSGNHFVEICLDENQNVWIMLHSGSRGLGNRVGTYFIEKAKKDMERFFINLPDKDLAYIPEGSDYFDDYMTALRFAQEFAKTNRELMLSATLMAIQQVIGSDKVVYEVEKAINCHHNYVNTENHFGKNVYVTRKGAVRAREGDLGIIPGSMGVKSFIVRGKGNTESFCSCSHGAGRVMSRTKARKEISLEQHIHDTQGVECNKTLDVIDESPRAYKDIDLVMKSQEDLVDIVATLKQILCVKG